MKTAVTVAILAAIACVMAVVAVVTLHPPAPPTGRPLVAQAHPAAATLTNPPPQAVVTNPMTSQAPATAAPAVSANRPSFQEHPFPAAYDSHGFQWTLADGKDTNVIRLLAHNESEYRRMVIENEAIYRRQLVYFTSRFASLAGNLVQTHQDAQQITLPGLDGQTFTVDVTRTDFRDGGSKGQIYGQLPDRPDSMVTVAFVNGREAFTIISPRDQIYLQAEAREPGQVVIKSVNPQRYGMLQH
jgi:hypothetical protein